MQVSSKDIEGLSKVLNRFEFLPLYVGMKEDEQYLRQLIERIKNHLQQSKSSIFHHPV